MHALLEYIGCKVWGWNAEGKPLRRMLVWQVLAHVRNRAVYYVLFIYLSDGELQEVSERGNRK